tara:strand:+ start:349 stop:579 length:231 start_codon:yes stop_codon:yes gene_type:complete
MDTPTSDAQAIRLRFDNIAKELKVNRSALAKEFNVTPAAISLWVSGKRSMPGPMIRLLQIYESNLGLSAVRDLRLG